MPRLEKVTVPLTALTVTAPSKDDPAEPAVMLAVTEEPVATLLLAESWKVRTG